MAARPNGVGCVAFSHLVVLAYLLRKGLNMAFVTKGQVANVLTIALAVVIGNVAYAWLRSKGYIK